MAGNLQFDINANDRAGATFAAVAAELKELGQQLDRIDGRNVRAKVTIDAPSAAQIGQLDRAKVALTEMDGRNARARVEITGVPDAPTVSRLRAAAKALRELDGQNATATIAISGTLPNATELRRTARALNDLQRIGSIVIDITITGDTAALARITALRRALGGIPRSTDTTVNVDVDRGIAARLNQLGTTLMKVGALGGVAAVGLASSTAAVASLAGSLASLAGLAPVAVGALAAFSVVSQTVKLGSIGMGDAMKALVDGKMDKFAEAVSQMSVQGAAFAQTLKALKGPFDDFRRSLQDQLFAGFSQQIIKLSGTYLPLLKSGMGGVAVGLNGMAKDLVGFATSASTVKDVDTIFKNTGAAVQAARPGVVNLAAAFRDVATVGTSMLPELATGWTGVTARFKDFIAQARESGQLEVWIRGGIDTLKQLGSIAGNVGTSLGAVFTAARASGADFLTTLDRVTAKVAQLLSSATGQSALITFFKESRAAVDALLPGVEALAVGVLKFVTNFSATGGLQIAAKGLSDIGLAIAPLLPQLGTLAGSALGGLGSALSNVSVVLVPLVTGLGSLLTGLGPVAPAILAAGVAFGGLRLAMSGVVSLGARVAAIGTAIMGSFSAAFVPGVAGVATALTAVGTALRFIGTAIPILGAVVVAISLFASANDDSAAAVQRHQSAIDGLKGTLDKVTGAATDATVAMQAQDIASRKLGDGTTSFATAIAGAGINLKDYTQAASGNQEALQKVNAELAVAAQRTPGLQALYAKWKPRLDEAGVSFSTLTAAALGNGGAFDELTSKLGVSAAGFDIWHQDLAAAVGPVGELGSALGVYSGTVAEAQKQTLDAAAAVKDFGSTLDAIKDGLGGIATGAAQTDVLRAGFRDLATSASDAANKVGEAAAKVGGVEAGGIKAAQSMEKSRAAFVEAAGAAGLTADQAGLLADQIGLIPAAAKTNFITNATGVAAEMGTLAQQVALVPGAKQITVQALSDEAKAKLTDLGFTVTTLPNGQVQVDVHDESGRQKLNDFLTWAGGQVTVLKVDANPDPATGKINATVQLGNGQTAIMTLDGNPDPVTGKIKATIDLGNGSKTTLILDGNPDPATGKINAVVDLGNGKHTVITIDPKDLASSVIANLQKPTSSLHTIYVQQVSVGANVTASGTVSAGGGAGGGLVGFSRGGIVPRRMGTGGVLPGYAPGVDTIPAILSPGEAVLVPELVKQLGPRNILAANLAASGGRAPAFWNGASPSVAATAMNTRTGIGGGGAGAGALVAELRGVRSDFARMQTEMVQIRSDMARAIAAARPVNVYGQAADATEIGRATSLALHTR